MSSSSATISGGGSPFSHALAAHLTQLPPALREHYFIAATTPYRVVLEGTMNRIWHRPAWLWPFFWLLTWADLLFPETGTDVPATMVLTGHDAPDASYQTWERTFLFATPRRFNAIMAYDATQGRVVEQLGPGHILHMAWDVRFVPPATIEIVTCGCALHLGRWRLALPALLYPTVRAVETALPDCDDRIHIDLLMTHPWLGAVFGYDGTFVLRREPRGTPQ